MPATYTHAVYGQQVLKQLDDQTAALIRRHEALYNIGLHGPDILFFYKPLSANPVKELGYAMHKRPARDFFDQARREIAASPDPEAALAYILGFINHFVLDSECHPFINQFEKQSGLCHSEIESEVDRALMCSQGLNPLSTRVTAHLSVSPAADQIIAPFFGHTPKEIDRALKSMIRYLNLFVAPQPFKRRLIFTVMKKAGVYASLHGLLINEQPNPKCEECTQEVLKRMTAALPHSLRLIGEYQRLLDGSQPLDSRYDEDYE